jgi:NADPH:quinone reductase-like Zn-dependent oxidoreductase
MPLFPRQAAGYAEFVAAPSRHLAQKPQGLSFEHAAALPLAGLTAYQGLIDVADLQPGQRILVHGAGGGVGHLAIQIAKAVGAYVIATASVPKHDFVESLGADEIIDYNVVDFADAVSDVDVVFETVGHGYAERSLRTLRPGGLLVTIVERTNMDLADHTRAEGKRFAGITVEPDYVGLERLSEMVSSGLLHVHVEHSFPLEQVAKAHELLTGNTKGKIVLSL